MRSLLLLGVLAACTGRSDFLSLKQLGDDCLENAECPAACIGGTCAYYAEGGEVCDEPEDCADSAHICPTGFCVVEGPPGFVPVPPGMFTTGSPAGEEGREVDEVQHEVTLTRAFWIQETEVTQSQFETVMGWNPSYFGPNGAGNDCGTNCPVEYVSWYDMLAYMNELSTSETLTPCYVLSNVECEDTTNVASTYMNCMNTTQGGINSATVALNGVSSVYDCTGYRLPTEAEWELAARAGTQTATYNGDLTAATLNCEQPNVTLNPIAWFCGTVCGGSCSRTEGPKPVATVPGPAANNLGLYDMLGNVWEWCWDWYEASLTGPITDPEDPGTGTLRVVRGGSWLGPAWYSRAACRSANSPGLRLEDFGGRPVRTVR